MKRRHFLHSGLTASAAMVIPSISSLAEAPRIPAAEGFSLRFMATDWGFGGTVDEFCAAAKKEGYDGIEVWWPGNETAQRNLFDALKKHQLQVGFLCGGSQPNATEHLGSFKTAVTAAAGNKLQKPLYINCHSGRDYFTVDENRKFIALTNQVSQQTGIPIYHETHRGRMCFAAHITRQFLELEPAMKLTLDISHWCNVHESLMADQPETIAKALERTEHIHSRIGHPEGPQVNDPRAPEWEATVKQHLIWWDTVINRKKKAGEPMTILTEFGPADYMPTLPYTRQPVADQWAINVYMMKLLKQRYA